MAMNHLTLADEIVVLMLDDRSGELREVFGGVTGVAIAGGLLMELALLGRIDTDLHSLFVVDTKPTGDDLLDATLREIAAEPGRNSSAWWVSRIGARRDELLSAVLARLVERGILREEQRRFLWVFERRAYPQVSGREEREAKARLMALLFSDTVPEPRDTLLLGLADVTGVLDGMLSTEERRKVQSRIEDVVALEEIGRSVGRVAQELQAALAQAILPL